MSSDRIDPDKKPPSASAAPEEEALEMDYSGFESKETPEENVRWSDGRPNIDPVTTYERPPEATEIDFNTPTAQPKLSAEERNWRIAAHLSAFSALLGVPFGHIVGPVTVYFIKRGDSPEVAQHALAAMRFHLSLTAYLILLGLLGWILGPAALFLLLFLVGAFFILPVLGAIKASRGEEFHYPLTLRINLE